MGTPVMNVIVPAGVVPGQAFTQVTCPPNVYGGQQMLVNRDGRGCRHVSALMMGQAMSATPTSTTNPTPLPTEEAIKAERASLCWLQVCRSVGSRVAHLGSSQHPRTSTTHALPQGRTWTELCNMCVASAVFCFLGCLLSGFIANMGLSNIGSIELSPFALPHLGVGACDAFRRHALFQARAQRRLVPAHSRHKAARATNGGPGLLGLGRRGSPDAPDCGRRSERTGNMGVSAAGWWHLLGRCFCVSGGYLSPTASSAAGRRRCHAR